jgi:hypothetical protein
MDNVTLRAKCEALITDRVIPLLNDTSLLHDEIAAFVLDAMGRAEDQNEAEGITRDVYAEDVEPEADEARYRLEEAMGKVMDYYNQALHGIESTKYIRFDQEIRQWVLK